MKETTATISMVLAFSLIAATLSVALVYAEPVAPTNLNEISSERRDLGGLSAQSADAQGGNVTEINIDALTITQSWQGYYGQISGEITLDDASQNTFYNWSMASVDGEVYATRVNSLEWANTACATAANITSEETALGQSASDGDSVSNTFDQTAHPAFNVSTAQITANNCPSTFGYVNNASQSNDWVQVLLHDGASNVIYSTLINDSTTGFDGSAYDFQLLVGENEHAGSEGVTAYYFWVELN